MEKVTLTDGSIWENVWGVSELPEAVYNNMENFLLFVKAVLGDTRLPWNENGEKTFFARVGLGLLSASVISTIMALITSGNVPQ